MDLVSITASRLSEDSWSPFGWIPVDDTDPRDAGRDLVFEWADPHLNVIAHAYEEVEHTEGGSVCSVMYRHDTHTQALTPLNVPCVVAVAPAAVDFSDASHLSLVRAFALEPLDSLVLFRGTWHWGPFPLGREPVRLLNVQGARYAEDNASVDLVGRTGSAIEVVAG